MRTVTISLFAPRDRHSSWRDLRFGKARKGPKRTGNIPQAGTLRAKARNGRERGPAEGSPIPVPLRVSAPSRFRVLFGPFRIATGGRLNDRNPNFGGWRGR